MGRSLKLQVFLILVLNDLPVWPIYIITTTKLYFVDTTYFYNGNIFNFVIYKSVLFVLLRTDGHSEIYWVFINLCSVLWNVTSELPFLKFYFEYVPSSAISKTHFIFYIFICMSIVFDSFLFLGVGSIYVHFWNFFLALDDQNMFRLTFTLTILGASRKQ
jgi:hypothetical protein